MRKRVRVRRGRNQKGRSNGIAIYVQKRNGVQKIRNKDILRKRERKREEKQGNFKRKKIEYNWTKRYRELQCEKRKTEDRES